MTQGWSSGLGGGSKTAHEVAFSQTSTRTTAELLSEYVFHEVAARLNDGRVAVVRVEVWENGTSCAVFEPEPIPAHSATSTPLDDEP